MEHDAVQVADGEQPMSADCGVARRDGLERAPTEIAREDDVHDVLGREAADGRNRVDDRNRSLDRQLVADPELLGKLAMQRVDEALAGDDAAPG